MVHKIEDKLVIAVASSALFDLGEADKVFQSQGEDAYRNYTRENENKPFEKGHGFSFIQRLLSVNTPPEFEPIEVILLSKNDADTGLRVFNTIEHYNLPISRAAFTCGNSPFTYISPFNASLFLSANENDVRLAVDNNLPAGIILAPDSKQADPNAESEELKIAFDFDGILADDSSEKIFVEKGLDSFQDHEQRLSQTPMSRGPLLSLLEKISNIQKGEFEKQKSEPFYKAKIRTAIITARNAPAHQRVIKTLRHWGIHVDQAFFLGGISKDRILREYQPHIFFDDQRGNLANLETPMAMVHVPYGIKNRNVEPE